MLNTDNTTACVTKTRPAPKQHTNQTQKRKTDGETCRRCETDGETKSAATVGVGATM